MQTDRWNNAIARGRAAAEHTRLAFSHLAGRMPGADPFEQPGDSLEFMDYREYEPGDDIRRIDWRAFARSDRLVVRRHVREVSPCVEIIVDGSASMDLPGTPKGEAAIAVAAALHAAATSAGRTARVSRFVERPEPVSDGSARFDRFPGFESVAALSLLHPATPAGSTRLLVSDLMTADAAEVVCRRLAQGAHAVGLVHLLSHEDVEAPPHGARRLVDAETRREVEVEIDEMVRRRFSSRVAAFREEVAAACRRTGVLRCELIAEHLWAGEPLDLSALARAGVLGAA